MPQKKQAFIDQFVNAVYGILLGFGFCNSMENIYKQPRQNYFYIAVVVLAIAVLCIHWWDWVRNVGERVETKPIEFVIDILILLNLEWLFFVYENLARFLWLMTSLALLNFIWVIHYRIVGFKSNAIKPSQYFFSKDVLSHIVKRFSGFLIYLCICLSYIFTISSKWCLSKPDTCNWLYYFFIIVAFIFDRKFLYRGRVLDTRVAYEISSP